MDIRCPKCAEPWEMDTLHEEVATRWPNKPWEINGKHNQNKYETYYEKVRKEFYAKGCSTFSASCNSATVGSPKAAGTSALMDMLGDDVDGLAAMLEDADQLGMW